MKYLLGLLGVFCLVVNVYASELSIAHFDMDKVLSDSKAGKSASQQFLQVSQGYEKEVAERNSELNHLKQQLMASRDNDLTVSEQGAIEKDMRTKERDLRRLIEGYRNDLNILRNRMNKQLKQQFQPIVRQYAQEHNLDYIFTLDDAFVYANEKRDVTNELIRAFDKVFTP